ncbi:hypothetical protein [Rhodococcus rhodochrous]|uniref:hypothetical protein n=1 Tax=Rhodococcus rhodochrous TaxID=1829 RepID=UPI00177DBB77|nr:hypothetical protein [Rhodococcus rhodochrous]QOH59885.1 hypothetical protein C6Y44_27735 [Rhodococcus rhodochrous]
MDVELAKARLPEIGSEEDQAEPLPPTPLGYSQSVYLQMATLEAIRSLDVTLRRVNGNNTPPPRPLPRPVTALQQLERERDQAYVNNILARLGVKGG